MPTLFCANITAGLGPCPTMLTLICAQIFSFVQDWRDVEGAIPYGVRAKFFDMCKLADLFMASP